MKNGTLILGISAAILGLAIAGNSKKEVAKENKVKSILFIGDSNTFLEYSYAHIIQKQFPNIRVKIISKIGSQTSWMLPELTKELSLNKYDVVSILGGSNDIYALDSSEKAKVNLAKMYALVKFNGARLIAISPPNKNFFIKRTDRKQKELQSLINFIVSNRSYDTYINFWGMTNDKKLFSSKDGYLHALAPAHDELAFHVIDSLKLK